MDFCLTKLLDYYANTKNPKATVDSVTELHGKIQELHDMGLSQFEVKGALAKITGEMSVDVIYDLTRGSLNADKITQIKMRSLAMQSKNLVDLVRDMSHNTHHIGRDLGRNVENSVNAHVGMIVKPMDQAIISRDGGRLFQEMQGFPVETFVQIMDVMDGTIPTTKSEPLDFLAQVFKKQNDTLFAYKSRAGAPDFKNNKYGFKIAYSAENIKAAGARQFILDILQSTNLKAQDLLGPAGEQIAKSRIANTLDFLKNPKTTEAMIRNAAASSEDTKMAKGLLRGLVESYDSFAPEQGVFSSDVMDQYGKVGTGKLFKSRQWEFNSNKAKMAIMERYGKHGIDVYKYIKDDSVSTAKILGAMDIWGVDVIANKDAVFNALESRALSNKVHGLTFDRAEAEAIFNYSLGRVHRIDNPFKLSEGFKSENIAALAKSSNSIATASYLAGSGLTQLFIDPASITVQYLAKSNENFFRSIPTIFKYYLGAQVDTFKEALSNNPDMFIELADITERTLGEVGFRERLKESVPGLLADKTMTFGLVQYFNKVSSLAAFRLLNHMVKRGIIDDADIVLSRYGMTPKDLDFLMDILPMVDSPVDVANLPDKLFINNPAKSRPFKYKQDMGKALGMYMEENRRQLAPQTGKAQGYMSYNIGISATRAFKTVGVDGAILNAYIQGLMHLKMLPFKGASDFRQLVNVKSAGGSNAVMRNGFVNSGILAAKYASIFGVAGMGLSFARDFAKTLDFQATYDDYMKDNKFLTKMVVGIGRYSAMAPAVEPFLNGRNAREVVEGLLTTPATKATVNIPVSVLSATVNLAMGREPIDYDNAKVFTEGVKSLVPGQTAINMTPYAEEYMNLQKKVIREIEKLDNM